MVGRFRDGWVGFVRRRWRLVGSQPTCATCTGVQLLLCIANHEKKSLMIQHMKDLTGAVVVAKLVIRWTRDTGLL